MTIYFNQNDEIFVSICRHSSGWPFKHDIKCDLLKKEKPSNCTFKHSCFSFMSFSRAFIIF